MLRMPICITGMHRSGTSMVARLMGELGVDLGPDEELVPGNAFNADGFWENRRFVELNDAILDRLGGGWDTPPPLTDGWEDSANLAPLYAAATGLVVDLGLTEPWAWKDPRTSLTLPFWRRAIPDLKVVVCLRNPFDVLLSLRRRGYTSPALSLRLWLEYNQRILASVSRNSRVITQYERYFEDPAGELGAVLRRLELPFNEKHLQGAVSAVKEELRHHRGVRVIDLRDVGFPEQAVELYTQMIEEASRGGRPKVRRTGSGRAASAEGGSASVSKERTGLAVAVATQQDADSYRAERDAWRGESERLKAALDEALGELEALRRQHSQLARKQTAVEGERARLEQSLAQQSEDARALAERLNRASINEASTRSKHAAVTEELRRVRRAFEASQRQREAIDAERLRLSIQEAEARGESRELRSRVRDLSAQLARAEDAMKRGIFSHRAVRHRPSSARATDDVAQTVGGDDSQPAPDSEQLAAQTDERNAPLLLGHTGSRRWRFASQFGSWVLHGRLGYVRRYFELRRSTSFDPEWYTASNPDVALTGLHPLLHYIEHGAREGRKPLPGPADATSDDPAAGSDLLRQNIEHETRDAAARKALRPRVRTAIESALPRDAVVAVISAGDEELVRYEGREAWHFPRGEDGRYSEFRSKSSLAAVAHFETLRARGAQYLVIPETGRSWLETHSGFARHLRTRYRELANDPACTIYDVRSVQAVTASWQAQLDEVIRTFRERHGHDATVLDFRTGCDLAAELPALCVFSPPDGDRLPYLDESIDVVAVGTDRGLRLDEALRVASDAVVSITAANGREPVVRWKREAETPSVPSVSIVVPCHDGIAYTRACLSSLRETLTPETAAEVIVVDDCSSDSTREWVEALASEDGRFKLLSNPANLGFLRSSNRGAAEATGDILIFLNNDTIMLPAWLEPLLRVLREQPETGVVGGRLLYPDGTLQEAGGLVFADASAAKFGYGDADPEDPLYSHLREVDYVSGCLLMTPRPLFEELGGFDERFAPGFYEDADYCFAVRASGRRVYYQPESTIVHVEGGTAGTDLRAGMKRHQVLNESTFRDKWAHILHAQPERPASLDRTTLHALAATSKPGARR
jgi:GT2 family glycosyltransferase